MRIVAWLVGPGIICGTPRRKAKTVVHVEQEIKQLLALQLKLPVSIDCWSRAAPRGAAPANIGQSIHYGRRPPHTAAVPK